MIVRQYDSENTISKMNFVRLAFGVVALLNILILVLLDTANGQTTGPCRTFTSPSGLISSRFYDFDDDQNCFNIELSPQYAVNITFIQFYMWLVAGDLFERHS